jgi:hypothetical protein
LVRKIKKRTSLEEPGVKEAIILKWMLAKEGVKAWAGFICSVLVSNSSCRERGILMSFQVA